jgi:hypothetical protein
LHPMVSHVDTCLHAHTRYSFGGVLSSGYLSARVVMLDVKLRRENWGGEVKLDGELIVYRTATTDTYRRCWNRCRWCWCVSKCRKPGVARRLWRRYDSCGRCDSHFSCFGQSKS